MSFDLSKILESKSAMRQRLAALPVAERLRLLDALRERELAIRNRAPNRKGSPGMVMEAPAEYGSDPERARGNANETDEK